MENETKTKSLKTRTSRNRDSAQPNVSNDKPEIMEMTDKEIGQKLKGLRKINGLTLKEVAALAGCTDAALSKIERGEVTPTIALLKKAVNVLGTTLSDFLTIETSTPESVVMRKHERIRMHFPTENINSYQLVRYVKEKQMQPLYEIIKPGGGSKGTYSHEGEEFGLVLEGELELTVDGVSYQIKEGDSFYFKSNRLHAFENKSDMDVKVIWIITPPTY